MRVNIEKFNEDFSLRPFGAKGWKNSKLLSCPHCGKDYTKFGVLLLEKGGVYKCFRCDIKGSIFRLLKLIDRRDLIIGDDETNYTYKEKLESFLHQVNVQEKDTELLPIKLPLGSERIFNHEYLTQRGWTEEDYLLNEVYVCNSLPRHRDRLIFPLRENNEIVAYLSRSIRTKEWHKQNLKRYKESGEGLILRYDNSRTDFEKVVGAIDEIIEGETITVIVVEGLFDKVNTSKVLELNNTPEVKCVYTFGCHLSNIQLYKLYEKGVKNIVLMFDPDTISQTKTVSLNLLNYFNIFIAEIQGDRDPGDMNLQEFELVLGKLKNPIEFFANRLENCKLR